MVKHGEHGEKWGENGVNHGEIYEFQRCENGWGSLFSSHDKAIWVSFFMGDPQSSPCLFRTQSNDLEDLGSIFLVATIIPNSHWCNPQGRSWGYDVITGERTNRSVKFGDFMGFPDIPILQNEHVNQHMAILSQTRWELRWLGYKPTLDG